jgi:hypothetical protein
MPSCLAVVLLGVLAGCGEQPTQTASTGVTTSGAPAVPTAARLLEQRGDQLNEAKYRALVSGNTLYRPLASGIETDIYLAPDDSERMRIQAPSGASTTDVGRQVLRDNAVCWQWQKAAAGHEMCFDYYWNGRILTMVDKSGQMQPAQFLIKQGNAENL